MNALAFLSPSPLRPIGPSRCLKRGERRLALLNPFPPPGIQSARPSGPSGRRERPRGRPDPPNGSPGPWEHKEGGHQRTRLPTRPSRLSGLDGGCPASRHAQPVNHGTSLSDPAATLATVSFHKVEHLCQVPLDGSDALLAQTCSAFLNMSAGAPPDGSWTAGPESRARTCSLRRNALVELYAL